MPGWPLVKASESAQPDSGHAVVGSLVQDKGGPGTGGLDVLDEVDLVDGFPDQDAERVHLRARQAARTRECLDERGAKLAAGSGYDDASRVDRIGDCVLQRWRTRSSSQGMPCSSGFAGSYSSVTRYAKRQSVSASYP